MHRLRLRRHLGAAGPHSPGLPALSLPRLWAAVQRAQRRAAEPDPVSKRHHRPGRTLAAALPPHAAGLQGDVLVRGILVSHGTEREWKAKLAPILTAELRQHRREAEPDVVPGSWVRHT